MSRKHAAALGASLALVLSTFFATTALAAVRGPATEIEQGKAQRDAVTVPEKGEKTEEAEAEGPPGPINWFDLSNHKQPPYGALVLDTAILFYLYYRFGKKAVVQGLKDRKDHIAKDIEGAQRILREAETRAERYQAKLEDVSADAEQGRKALIAAGEGERDALLRDAQDKAARMRRDADFLLDQEGKQLRLDLTRETVEAAVAAAEGMIAKGMTSADHERLAQEFLDQLARERPGASSGGAS